MAMKYFRVFLSTLVAFNFLCAKGSNTPYGKLAKQTVPVTENKSIVLVVRSFNNEAVCEKNMASILSQDYPNFRVIFIDDTSTDATFDKVAAYVKEHDTQHRVTMIRNSERFGALANCYYAVHRCKDDEIVAIVDGDDWLKRSDALSILNAYYANPDVWMTYGNHECYPYRKGIAKLFDPKKLADNGLRKVPFVASHLRTFYAALFKQVKLKDLFHSGKFYPIKEDIAYTFPMMEMARGHIYFVPEVLYVYNTVNPLNDFRKDQEWWKKIESEIQNLPSYQPLEQHPFKIKRPIERAHVGMIVSSYNRPMQLYAYLESLEKHMQNVHHIKVIYRASDDKYEAGYAVVKKRFPNVQYIRQLDPPHDFKKLTLDALQDSYKDVDFIPFGVDDIIFKDTCDLDDCARLMDKTGAYGLFLRMGRHINFCYMLKKRQPPPRSELVESGVYAWQFCYGVADWAYPNSLDMTVYRIDQILPTFQKMTYSNPNLLESHWAKRANKQLLGLCYEQSKIVNIPVNVVSTFKNRNLRLYSAEQLLDMFFEGKKIDINAYYQMENSSPHIMKGPTFIALSDD